MIFFLCSGSYTLCKKKPYLNQPLRHNRTNVFTTSHLAQSNLFNNSMFRSDRTSTTNFNDDLNSTTQYYSNTNSSTNNETSISFIDTPPPPYWQIMNHPISPNSPSRAPPSYTHLNVSNLNKQESK
jgi:hypothetical protein